MKNFCIFSNAVNFIEKNLCEDLTQEEIAASCFCSLSALQKIWRYCTHTSLKEYISKRRLTCSAEDILKTEMSITEIAMKYQYNSPEVFSRAFNKLWGTSPSKFKTKWHSSGIFPQIIPDEKKLEGGIYMGRRIDISQLYDELQKTERESYVLCFDVAGLEKINIEKGRSAGDAVILEAFRRIDAMAGDNMLAFRIGGDEFAVVTGLTEKSDIEKISEEIISLNGRSVKNTEQEIPVSLRISALKLKNISSHHINCNDLFDRMQRIMNNTHDLGRVVFFD